MKRVVEIVVLHSTEPDPAIFLIEMKVLVFARIEDRPAFCRIDASGKLRHAVHGMHFVPCVQQALHHMPPDKSGSAGNQDLTHF